MHDAAEWTRSVEVIWAKPGNLDTESSSDLGVKRVAVTVSRGGVPIYELVAARSVYREDPLAPLENE